MNCKHLLLVPTEPKWETRNVNGISFMFALPFQKLLTFALYTLCEPPCADCRARANPYLTDKWFASFKLRQLFSAPVHTRPLQALQAILSPAIISLSFRDRETPLSKLKGGKCAKTRHYHAVELFWSFRTPSFHSSLPPSLNSPACWDFSTRQLAPHLQTAQVSWGELSPDN